MRVLLRGVNVIPGGVVAARAVAGSLLRGRRRGSMVRLLVAAPLGIARLARRRRHIVPLCMMREGKKKVGLERTAKTRNMA